MPEQGKRNDILAMKAELDGGASLKEISQSHFPLFIRYHRGIKEYKLLNAEKKSEAKKIECLWGPTGSGKSRYCWETYPDAYRKTKDPGNAQYWDGYDGQDTIIVEEYYGWLPWSWLLTFTDRYPSYLAVKGATVPMLASTIIFTSNSHPSEWYPNSRYRWDASNPLKRRFGDGIREITLPSVDGGAGGSRSMVISNTTLGGDGPARDEPVRFRNGLPAGVITPANVYSLVGDDELGIGC